MQTSKQMPANHNSWNNPQSAFQQAIKDGRLSDDLRSPLFAGHFMYMGHNEAGKALFKNIINREYLA